MEYLTQTEIRAQQQEIRPALERLIENRVFAGRPQSRQWRFLRACLARLFSPDPQPEFEALSPAQAAQLKFEVEGRLRRFYQRPGPADDFVFVLVHQKRAAELGLGPDYPQLAGYCLLVRALPLAELPRPSTVGKAEEEYLERFLVEAMQAEFAAFAALPAIQPEALPPYFIADSPALREILHVLLAHAERGWVLSNPLNPSTHRVLRVRFKEDRGDELLLGSEEYWYLKWWDSKRQRTTYVYRETNLQTYVLRQEDGVWKIYQNLRPLPRTSLPLRWKDRRRSA